MSFQKCPLHFTFGAISHYIILIFFSDVYKVVIFLFTQNLFDIFSGLLQFILLKSLMFFTKYVPVNFELKVVIVNDF